MDKNFLNQITSIENLEENGTTFDELVECIKKGRADGAVNEMLGWTGESDRDPISYEDLLDSALALDERIVYDDGTYVLTASNDIITLYEYTSLKDMLGDDLNIGDEVLWADPDDEARDLNRVWKVYEFQSEEMVCIATGEPTDEGYSEAEVPPSELVKKSSILHVECVDGK